MKKYQLWLQRKSYSQHLFNLMKIKNANRSSAEKNDTPATRTPNHNQSSTMSRYKDLEDHHSADKLGDISYGITFKELKNRKLRLMRSFEILNENLNMARRVKDVKSSVSGTFKSKNNSEHQPNKRRLFQKKCQLSNEELRQKNFKQFKKWQNHTNNPLHRYHFTLTVESISKLLSSQAEYAAAWCEISTEKGFTRSELVRVEEFQGHKFNFALDHELPKDCLFRLYVCKGLDSNFIGQVQFRRANLGQSLVSTHRSDDCLFQMTIGQKYQKVKKQKPVFRLK